ncbi:hypothetical protein DUNSADRAFT_13127 [Dunaliella salina]|uniref:Uncharacterized protein n=1 Tax=Dunaliella salina TaxID=3046 RepID=A0ABQ7GA27_DUNSA|nr:hypothetical protein DUNSADRAFT_13127 [Dunaliella salina]|eukprot:KAF5831452.1 hypothetical protein DUNSADRAFT_13127 [Dunaliella salina]
MIGQHAIVPHPQYPQPDIDQRATDGYGDEAYYDSSSWRRGGSIQEGGLGGTVGQLILPPPGFTVWDLPPNKLKTGAIAATFISTAGFITLLAAAGLLAVLLTGAVVMMCTMLIILVCAGLTALVVTGAPIGFGIYKAVEALNATKRQARRQ